jgi:hypothetical protein
VCRAPRCDLRGINKVSCFSQYAADRHFHPADCQSDDHGATPKDPAPPRVEGLPGCHGTQYASGVLPLFPVSPGSGVNAPHAGAGLPVQPAGLSTDPNATECAQCRRGRLLTNLPRLLPTGRNSSGCFTIPSVTAACTPRLDRSRPARRHRQSQPGSDKDSRCKSAWGRFYRRHGKVSCSHSAARNGACHGATASCSELSPCCAPGGCRIPDPYQHGDDARA